MTWLVKDYDDQYLTETAEGRAYFSEKQRDAKRFPDQGRAYRVCMRWGCEKVVRLIDRAPISEVVVAARALLEQYSSANEARLAAGIAALDAHRAKEGCAVELRGNEAMTQSELQGHVHVVIHQAGHPVSFGDVRSGVALRCGEGLGFRDVDRALQALRRRKVIEYRKSAGAKGTHGWVATELPIEDTP